MSKSFKWDYDGQKMKTGFFCFFIGEFITFLYLAIGEIF